MIHIVGENVIPESLAFNSVRDALNFDCDVYLAAMWAPIIGVHIPDNSVIYNLEPLNDTCRSFTLGYLDTLRRCRVLDYDRKNVDYLSSLGISAFHLPYRYHDSLARTPKAEKTIDYLLVGSVNPRREQIVYDLRKYFNIVWVTGAYGAALDALVDMSKVCLNIHYLDDHPLEVVRLNYLMASHATIVTEPGNDPTVNDDYSKGVYMETEQFADAMDYALTHPLDGSHVIQSMRMDCVFANNWLKGN